MYSCAAPACDKVELVARRDFGGTACVADVGRGDGGVARGVGRVKQRRGTPSVDRGGSVKGGCAAASAAYGRAPVGCSVGCTSAHLVPTRGGPRGAAKVGARGKPAPVGVRPPTRYRRRRHRARRPHAHHPSLRLGTALRGAGDAMRRGSADVSGRSCGAAEHVHRLEGVVICEIGLEACAEGGVPCGMWR